MVDCEFYLTGGRVRLLFDPNKDVKKLLKKINQENNYPFNDLQLDFSDFPESPIKINEDFSCNLKIKGLSWQDISKINKDKDIQDEIQKEFIQYGFKPIRKYHDENWGLEPYGKVMYFEFYNRNIL